jgi:hypothetical protein
VAKWNIEARETLFYAFQVEAETQEEAENKARDFDISKADNMEGQDFEILSAAEVN